MKPRHLARLLKRIENQLDADDIAAADTATLDRLYASSEALNAAIAAEHAHRATRSQQRPLRTPAWTLREFKVAALPTASQ